MAIVSLKMKPGTWNGSAQAQTNGLLYEVIRRQYSATYICKTDTPVFGPEGIHTDPACFVIGSAYAIFADSDTVATCVNVSAKSTKNPWVWEIDVDFDTDRIVAAITTNPLNQPPLIRWSSVKAERPLLRSNDGVAVYNSSWERFDPSLTYEEVRPVCTITRNEASFSSANAFEYQNTLNAEAFAGADPLCARINSISGDQQISNGVLYYQVTYEIEFRIEGFAYLVLDQGFRDYDRQLFRDPVDFAPLSAETFLNGNGYNINEGVTYLTQAMLVGDTTAKFNDYTVLPPGCELPTADGWIPSGDYTFDVLIDDEIITVTSYKGTLTPGAVVNIVRGAANTTPAAHALNSVVTLQPYYKRFLASNVKSFVPLALPTI